MLASCSKSDVKQDPIAQLPPETQTGANTFGVTINGKVSPHQAMDARVITKRIESIEHSVGLETTDGVESEHLAEGFGQKGISGEDRHGFAVRDVKDAVAPAKEPAGLVLMNPPYGERIGEEADMAALYKTIGDSLKAGFQGYDAFVFTGNLEAAKRIGLKAARRTPLFNGPIDCRLFKYELYGGSRRVSAPVVNLTP